MIIVRIPGPLRPYTDNNGEVRVSAVDVASALDDLRLRHQAVASALFAETGELRPHVNVYVNRTDIRDLAGSRTPLQDGDVVSIVPSIAGG